MIHDYDLATALDEFDFNEKSLMLGSGTYETSNAWNGTFSKSTLGIQNTVSN